jgi:hypothetical protein
VVGLEEVIGIGSPESRRLGTAEPIVNLFREVWKEEHHVFSAEGTNGEVGKSNAELGHPDQTSSNTLNRYPVEVHAIKETSTSRDKRINSGQDGSTLARPGIFPTT